MKLLRGVTLVGGLVILLFAFGFIFRLPFATAIWPWEDGRYSYLFIGSILAAVSAAALWIGWTGEFGALPAGSLNVFVIGLTTSIYFFLLASQGRADMALFGVFAALAADHQPDRIFLEREDPAQRIPSHARTCENLFLDIHRLALPRWRGADPAGAHLPLGIEPRYIRHLWLYLPRRRLLLPLRHVPTQLA